MLFGGSGAVVLTATHTASVNYCYHISWHNIHIAVITVLTEKALYKRRPFCIWLDCNRSNDAAIVQSLQNCSNLHLLLHSWHVCKIKATIKNTNRKQPPAPNRTQLPLLLSSAQESSSRQFKCIPDRHCWRDFRKNNFMSQTDNYTHSNKCESTVKILSTKFLQILCFKFRDN